MSHSSPSALGHKVNRRLAREGPLGHKVNRRLAREGALGRCASCQTMPGGFYPRNS
ncbi:MAG: hypothetical protein ABF290_16930 [Thiogranum sp.]